jgi:hypothetical protein
MYKPEQVDFLSLFLLTVLLKPDRKDKIKRMDLRQ